MAHTSRQLCTIHKSTHTHVHAYTHTHTFTITHTHTYTHAYKHAHSHTCAHTHRHAPPPKHPNTHIHTQRAHRIRAVNVHAHAYTHEYAQKRVHEQGVAARLQRLYTAKEGRAWLQARAMLKGGHCSSSSSRVCKEKVARALIGAARQAI
jgi:hypothetical protein